MDDLWVPPFQEPPYRRIIWIQVCLMKWWQFECQSWTYLYWSTPIYNRRTHIYRVNGIANSISNVSYSEVSVAGASYHHVFLGVMGALLLWTPPDSLRVMTLLGRPIEPADLRQERSSKADRLSSGISRQSTGEVAGSVPNGTKGTSQNMGSLTIYHTIQEMVVI